MVIDEQSFIMISVSHCIPRYLDIIISKSVCYIFNQFTQSSKTWHLIIIIVIIILLVRAYSRLNNYATITQPNKYNILLGYKNAVSSVTHFTYESEHGSSTYTLKQYKKTNIERIKQKADERERKSKKVENLHIYSRDKG